MNKLFILLFGITALFSSFDGCFVGIEGRYEYNIYSSSLSADKNVSITSKNKLHSKLIPAIFVGRNHIFGKNYFFDEFKSIFNFSEDPKLFNAFKRHNITPHLIKFRHYNFWDSGIHCVTTDLHRVGTIKDYFPERS